MEYKPHEWTESQNTKIWRAISDLEEHCNSLPEEQQDAFDDIIDVLKCALRGDICVTGE